MIWWRAVRPRDCEGPAEWSRCVVRWVVLHVAKLGWGEVAWAVGSVQVVVDAPVLEEHSCFAEAVEVPAG